MKTEAENCFSQHILNESHAPACHAFHAVEALIPDSTKLD